MADDEDITIKSVERTRQQEITEDLAVHSTGITDIGNKRLHNEDAFFASDEKAIWAVADGMGGHNAGDFASRSIVEAIAAYSPASSPGDTVRDLENIVKQANTRLIESAAEVSADRIIGSTVIVFTVTGSEGAILWAGDSRIYRVREGDFECLTLDHSLVNEMVAKGMITPEEAETHPESHKITRAVGYQDEIRLDIRTVTILPGDRYIMCSDGLYKEISEDEIYAIAAAERTTESACEKLLHRTLETKARDNITIIAIDFSAE